MSQSVIIDCANGNVTSAPAPTPDLNAAWTAIRAERNALLAACDWTQLPDAPVEVLPWAIYRQALRDITQQTDVLNITWPTPPEF